MAVEGYFRKWGPFMGSLQDLQALHLEKRSQPQLELRHTGRHPLCRTASQASQD